MDLPGSESPLSFTFPMPKTELGIGSLKLDECVSGSVHLRVLPEGPCGTLPTFQVLLVDKHSFGSEL